jgi:hypothetical protein
MPRVVDALDGFASIEDRRQVESLSRGARDQFLKAADAEQVGSRWENAGLLARGETTRAIRPTTQTWILSNSLAWAMPGAGRPHSLAVTRASATSCRQRKAGRVVANSSRTVL